jgi:tRNA dimethylallyltransferase
MHRSQNRNLLVICGPTASGKTRLAARLARKLNGEILSADSRQVYRGMDIGTGKDLDEFGEDIRYHLIDIADPAEIYTVHQYQRDFYRAFREIRDRGALPIMVGGTGLYIEAVLNNYAIPNVPENPSLRRTLMHASAEDLVAELAKKNRRLLESTDLSSKKRIVRALEVAMYAEKHALQRGAPDAAAIEPLVLCVRWPRDQLHQRIQHRLQQRLAHGMIDEVERLLSGGVSPERFELFGMEYKHIARYVRGEVDYEAMVEHLARDIRRLAKRQQTWFRGMARRGIPVHWVECGDFAAAREIVDRLGGFDMK